MNIYDETDTLLSGRAWLRWLYPDGVSEAALPGNRHSQREEQCSGGSAHLYVARRIHPCVQEERVRQEDAMELVWASLVPVLPDEHTAAGEGYQHRNSS